MKQRWKVLLVTSVAVFMGFLDVTIVNIAFPDIEASFPGTSLAGLSWILNAYNIVFAAFLLAGGKLADLLGRRRIFMAGLAIFTLASALCAIAPSADALTAYSVVQAVVAALVVAVLLLVLGLALTGCRKDDGGGGGGGGYGYLPAPTRVDGAAS